jgi:two-component system invasion response regulator UvrY
VIRVVLVDSHRLVRAGLRRLLEEAPGVQVVGEADGAEQIFARVQADAPDVLLMDVHPLGVTAAVTVQALLARAPGLKVIVLTAQGAEPYPGTLLESGAAGFLSKACSVEEFLAAIRAVHRGERYVGNDIAQQLAHSLLPGGERSPFDTLSHRELEVMGLLTRGHSVQRIAERLGLSPKTVNTYRYRLYGKLGIGNDVELTRLALRYDMVDTAPSP